MTRKQLKSQTCKLLNDIYRLQEHYRDTRTIPTEAPIFLMLAEKAVHAALLNLNYRRS